MKAERVTSSDLRDMAQPTLSSLDLGRSSHAIAFVPKQSLVLHQRRDLSREVIRSS